MKITLNNIYQLPLKKQLPLFGAIFLIVLIAGYLWDISKLKTNIANAHDQEIDLKQQIDMAISKEGSYQDELKQATTSQQLLTKWQARLITPAQLPALLKEILKMGAVNNIEFSLFNPDDAVLKDGIYTKLPINIIMVGSYHQTADFISQLANAPNIIVIKNFTISNENKADELGSNLAQKANAAHLLTIKMQLEIYFLPEKITNAQ